MVHFLREGLICLESPWDEHQLYDLVKGRSRPLDAEQARLSRALIRGLDDDTVQEAIAALGDDVVQRREEAFDRVLRARLEELDADFSWLAPPGSKQLIQLCELCHSLLRHSRQDLDQLPVLPETSVRRALLLRERLEPGAEVALVGDDDLVCVPAALLGLRPTVLELDHDLIDVIHFLAARLGLTIEIEQLDLKQPLPERRIASFDAFCTDPEASRECVTLFLSRGMALTRPGGFGLMACAEEHERLVEEILAACSATRRKRYRRFANYRDMTAILAPYRSDLHAVEVTPEATPIVPADAVYEESLFPFGLSRGHHLIATFEGCSRTQSEDGKDELGELLRDVIGGQREQVTVEEHRPLPIRVLSARSSTSDGEAQITVHAGGHMATLTISPAPETEEAVSTLTKRATAALGAQRVRFETLRRLE